MLGRGVGFFEVVAGTVIDGRNFRIKRQGQIAFDGGHRGAHLMAGGADKVGAALLFGALIGDVTKNDDCGSDLAVLAEERRNVEADW